MTEENLNITENNEAINTQVPDVIDAPIASEGNTENATPASAEIAPAGIVSEVQNDDTIAGTCIDHGETIVDPIVPALPIHSQAGAQKVAINASASYHLSYLHSKLIEDVIKVTAQILENTPRTTIWTLEETLEILNRVESEVKSTL